MKEWAPSHRYSNILRVNACELKYRSTNFPSALKSYCKTSHPPLSVRIGSKLAQAGYRTRTEYQTRIEVSFYLRMTLTIWLTVVCGKSSTLAMAVLQGIDYGMEELKEAMAQYVSNAHSSRTVLTKSFRLYDTKEDADLEIVCGGTKLKVHSLLLWPRCKFFAAACKCGFKVTMFVLGQVENKLTSV